MSVSQVFGLAVALFAGAAQAQAASVYKGTSSIEPYVVASFGASAKKGKAWISIISYGDDMMVGGSTRSQAIVVEAPVSLNAQGQVIDVASGTVCAELKEKKVLFFHTKKLVPTGNCSLVTQSESLGRNAGYSFEVLLQTR